jgi:hypothetical protein
MYTSTGWVSAATGVLCFLLFTPLVFRESYISEKELAAVQKIVKVSYGLMKQAFMEPRRIQALGTRSSWFGGYPRSSWGSTQSQGTRRPRGPAMAGRDSS